MTGRREKAAPRYEEIAMDLAQQIVDGRLREGERILGRSSLAARYKVSPETIRRAVAILQAHGVVQALPGSGVRIASRSLAAEYLRGLRTRGVLAELQEQLQQLLAEQEELGRRIVAVGNRLAQHANRALESLYRLTELPIPAESWLVGQTLASAALRNRTGVTVVSIVRGEQEFSSPPPDLELRSGDLLLIAGSREALGRFEAAVAPAAAPAVE